MTSMANVSVLLVASSLGAGSVTRDVLRGLGFRTVHLETDPEKALAYARVRPVRLLVVDHTSRPGTTGLEPVVLFRDAGQSPCPDAPIVFVSPDAERARIEAARDAGVDHFCVKPVQAGALAARLARLLERRAA
jgi:CheY-like chemotaxis protein